MDGIIEADLFRYGGATGKKGFLLLILRNPGFRHTYFLRKASKCTGNPVKRLFYKILIRRSSHKYGFQFYQANHIGKGFYIGHFGTIVINSNVKIGNNCNITHGVTIGGAIKGNLYVCPTIGDKVWIGTGSVIVGGIKIGSNVFIAPNSYVNFDIPANSYVRGNPARVFPMDNATDTYINYILEEAVPPDKSPEK